MCVTQTQKQREKKILQQFQQALTLFTSQCRQNFMNRAMMKSHLWRVGGYGSCVSRRLHSSRSSGLVVQAQRISSRERAPVSLSRFGGAQDESARTSQRYFVSFLRTRKRSSFSTMTTSFLSSRMESSRRIPAFPNFNNSYPSAARTRRSSSTLTDSTTGHADSMTSASTARSLAIRSAAGAWTMSPSAMVWKRPKPSWKPPDPKTSDPLM